MPKTWSTFGTVSFDTGFFRCSSVHFPPMGLLELPYRPCAKTRGKNSVPKPRKLSFSTGMCFDAENNVFLVFCERYPAWKESIVVPSMAYGFVMDCDHP